MLPEIKTGTYTGTGAAQSVTLGYKPAALIIVNETDGDVVNVKIAGSTDATHIAIGAAAAAVASGGITLSATGFSVGTDASVSESAKVFRYIALGNTGLTAAGA